MPGRYLGVSERRAGGWLEHGSAPSSSALPYSSARITTQSDWHDNYPRGRSWASPDGNICIIEMRNCPVDSSIIPQVLQYAFWAERNPDSVRSLWLKRDNRPDDVTLRILPSLAFALCDLRVLCVESSVFIAAPPPGGLCGRRRGRARTRWCVRRRAVRRGPCRRSGGQ